MSMDHWFFRNLFPPTKAIYIAECFATQSQSLHTPCTHRVCIITYWKAKKQVCIQKHFQSFLANSTQYNYPTVNLKAYIFSCHLFFIAMSD